MDNQDLTAIALRDNRRFRRAVIVFLALIAVGLLISGIAAFSIDEKNSQLLKTQIQAQANQLDQLNHNAKTRTSQINKLQAHIDCIVDLFTLPNRANLTITDISSCRLSTAAVATSSSSVSVPATPKSEAPAAPATSATPSVTSKTTAPSNPTAPKPPHNLLTPLVNFIEGL